jgi:hypothetical protein
MKRLAYAAALVLMALLLLGHLRELHWLRFALAFRRARGGAIHPLYHHLYNVTHSFLTAAIVILIWIARGGGPEWAMLAIPLHLCGDRALFGNGPKPVTAPFERLPAGARS